MTFTLPGFSTVKRDGIELTGSQTLTIPVEMRVGGLEETITVTGESPVVDVQNARAQLVLSATRSSQTIPATRAAGALLNATPGIIVGETGAALSPTMTSFNARSSTINSTSVAGEGRYAINGFPLTAARSGGFSSYVYDTVNADEVAITVGGGLGESDIGGPLMNIVPKSGGNSFSGSAFLSTAGEWSSGNNLTDELQALNPNLRQTPGVINAYDCSVSFGGPIMQGSALVLRQLPQPRARRPRMEGIVANANAGDPTRWDWVGPPINVAASGAGPQHDHRPPDGAVREEPHPVQLRVPARAARARRSRSRARAVTSAARTGSASATTRRPTQMSPEATSTAGRGYFDVPFYVNQGTWTMPAIEQAALRCRLHVVPLPADLRPPGAGRHHQPDPGHRAVERDQPGDRHSVSRRWRTTATAGWRAGGLPRARPTTSTGRCRT